MHSSNLIAPKRLVVIKLHVLTKQGKCSDTPLTPPQVPHGSLGKGSGTPKNLARSHVLVAKVLTNSDAHGRIILPRVSVEANLTFLMGYRQAMHCKLGNTYCVKPASTQVMG